MRCCRISASTLVLSSAGLVLFSADPVLSADTVRWSFTVIARVARMAVRPSAQYPAPGGVAELPGVCCNFKSSIDYVM